MGCMHSVWAVAITKTVTQTIVQAKNCVCKILFLQTIVYFTFCAQTTDSPEKDPVIGEPEKEGGSKEGKEVIENGGGDGEKEGEEKEEGEKNGALEEKSDSPLPGVPTESKLSHSQSVQYHAFSF